MLDTFSRQVSQIGKALDTGQLYISIHEKSAKSHGGRGAVQTDKGFSPVNSLPSSPRWGARWLWWLGAFRVTPAPSSRPPWAGKPPASALAPSPSVPNQYALISCPFAEVTETGLINYFCRCSLKCASGTTSECVTFFSPPPLPFLFLFLLLP